MKNTKNNLLIFSKVMWGIAEDFGGKISPEGMKMRFKALEEYSINQITASGTWLIKNRQKTFPAVPTTKEFIDVIEGWEKPKISTESKAEIQAANVLACLRRWGRNWKPEFSDPVTQILMTERWPWYRWALSLKEDQEQWWKKDFMLLYKAYTEEEKATQMMLEAPVIGLGKIGVSNVKKIASSIARRME